MRAFSLVLAATVLLSAASSYAADPVPEVGRLHRIDITAAHPKAYHPSIGDLVQCYMDFPIVPEQIVDNLLVKTNGRTLSVIGVVGTSKPKIVGSGQISLYLVPRQAGMTKVTIQSVIPGQQPKPIEISFIVEAERNN